MKKVLFVKAFLLISLLSFSQTKEEVSKPKVSENLIAKIVSDTLVVSETSAKFIKVNGRLFPSEVLKTEMLPVSMEWIVNVFNFITGSKNSDYTVDQIDKIRQPLIPYVEYLQKLQQQQQQQKKQ